MRFGQVHRMSDRDYGLLQSLIREAQQKRARIERPELEGEPFLLRRYGHVIAECSTLGELDRELARL